MTERIQIKTHFDLNVYQESREAANRLFILSRNFPREEKFALTDQVRRSSRSVSANLAEGWRKRMYEAAFVSKLADCEGEAAETQTWIQFAVDCGYFDRTTGTELFKMYDRILGMLVAMRTHPEKWLLKKRDA